MLTTYAVAMEQPLECADYFITASKEFVLLSLKISLFLPPSSSDAP
jgi:hypothetical protein